MKLGTLLKPIALGAVLSHKDVMQETILTHLFKKRTDLVWSYLIPRLSDYSNRSDLC